LTLSPSDLEILGAKLKSTQNLKSLSLSVQESVTKDIAMGLEQGVLKNRSLRELALRMLNVGPGAVQVLVAAAAKNPCLTSLDLSYTTLPKPQTQDTDSILHRPELLELSGLMNPLLSLKELNLHCCALPAPEFEAIADCLSRTPSYMVRLDLSGNAISEHSALQLAAALKTNTSLISLRLRDCSLGDSGINALAQFLLSNTFVSHINIASNNIGPLGAAALAEGIAKSTSLGHLNISHNPLFHPGLRPILESVSKSDSLRELNMSFCQFEAASWSLLAQSINTWSKLWKMNLSGNMQFKYHVTSPHSTVTKAHTISGPPNSAESSSPTLSSLILSEAPVSTSPIRKVTAAKRAAIYDQAQYVKSLEELCSALQVNCCLSNLDLSHNLIGDVGCKSLETLLASNQALVELKLKRCGITMKGVGALFAGVKANQGSSLSFVDITGNEADGLGPLGDLIIRARQLKSLAWRPVRTHPIVQKRPHAEFTCICPIPVTQEVWVACTDGHVHFWPVSDEDNIDDDMHCVDVHSKPVPLTRRRINAMVACKSTVWTLTDESTIVVISQSKPHHLSYLTMPSDNSSERLCMQIVDIDNQIAVLGGGSGDISLWKTAAGEECMIARRVLGAGFPVVAVASTPTLILAGLVMPGRHSSIVVVLDHALEELYRQEVSTSTLCSMTCFGNLVVTTFQDNTIKLWHCDSREMGLTRSYSHVPAQSIQNLHFYFASSSPKHRNIWLWNPSTLTPVCILDTAVPVKSIALSDSHMAVLTEDEQVSLWIN